MSVLVTCECQCLESNSELLDPFVPVYVGAVFLYGAISG